MDNLMENINGPRYVNFTSESFLESLNTYDDDLLSDTSKASLKLSNVEGCLSTDEENLTTVEDEGYEASESSFPRSENEYVIHTRASKSQMLKGKKTVTVPKPFQFQTDDRLKNKKTLASPNEKKDFISQLRQHTASHPSNNRVTKVKPFNLTEGKKKNTEPAYVPFAEQVKALQKTPDRYHSSSVKEFQPQEHWSPPKLRPRTPKLQAVKRHRTIYALSREELEEKELEDIKAHEFHAQPIDPRIYKPPVMEKRIVKRPTKPKAIKLKTDERSKKRPQEEPGPSYEFHARPLPKKMLAGPIGLGEKPEVVVTKPISPAFRTNKRLEKRKLMMEQQKEETPVKKMKTENGPSSCEKITKPKFVKPVPTKVEPFSFDQYDKQRYMMKEIKIQSEIEKENKPFIFKAQLLPSPSVSSLPKVERKHPTQPQPFNFLVETRNLRNRSIIKEESFSFKAQPATVLTKDPFIPEKQGKHTIAFKEFDLNTEKRASLKLKLQEEKEAEELKMAQIKLARKALEEKREQEEIAKLRQELVHKANPVRQYKTVEIKKSTKELTMPKTPHFKTDRRLRERSINV